MSAVEAPGAAFLIVDPVLASAMPQALGPWTTTSPPGASSVSFGTATKPEVGAELWRVSLPSDPAEAARVLSWGEVQLMKAERAITQAEWRLGAVALAGAATEASFAAVPDSVLRDAESELLADLQALTGSQDHVGFGPRDQLQDHIEPVIDTVQRVLQSLQQMISQFARVITEVEGRLVGETLVAWLGDTKTTWRTGLTFEQARLHQRALHMTVASRTALLRLMGVTLNGAAVLVARMSLPGGVLLALPFVWRFVTRVLTEYEAYRTRREIPDAR